MTTWLFIGPTLLSGIGQVTRRYAALVKKLGHEVEYCPIGEIPKKSSYDKGFAFILPIENQLVIVDKCTALCKKVIYMTVCETEPVNDVYKLLTRYKCIYCPSEFSRSILAKQFPSVEWKLLRHWVETESVQVNTSVPPYVFYTIGNILDPRKNIQGIVNAFNECNFEGKARLVMKASCLRRVEIPGVIVINGLISDEKLEEIHKTSHCYINCSHSEGVGMGAVEAAMMSKPVIIADYGGLKEYVDTPYVVKCTKGPIGYDDFLFTKELTWGHPSHDDLVKHMRHCFDNRVMTWSHPKTKNIMKEVESQFARF